MRLWSRLRSWWNATLRRPRMESEMDRELRFHQQAYAEDLIHRGVSCEEAMRRARLEFGGIERAKEECREARGVNLVESLIQDLRYGARTLGKNPGFTVTAVLTLALGIGASTSVFSLINAVLIRSLPYHEPERLVYLWSPNPRFEVPIEYLTPMTADFFDLQRQNHSFATLALFGVARFNVVSAGRADVWGGARVTGDFFPTMGISPKLGRPVSNRDDQPGQDQVVVISDRLWRGPVGAEPHIFGKKTLLDPPPRANICVLPARVAGSHRPDAPAAATLAT